MHLVPSLAALAVLSSLVYGQQQRVCNNAAALCDRSYGNITHLGAHDSFSVRNASNSYSVAADQFYTTLQQLDAGVRLVTAQVHRSSGGDAVTNEGSAIGSGAVAQYGKTSPQVENGASSAGNAVATGAKQAAATVASGTSSALDDAGNALSSVFGGNGKRQADDLQEWRLCHSNCLLYDGGSMVDWLSGIKGWLDAHPTDVVTVLLVNSDNADAATLKSVFAASGAEHYAYTPPKTDTAPSDWPTLNDLIGQGKRLMVFTADLEPAQNSVAPYLMNEFSFIFENNYDNDSPSDFSCQPNRPSTLENNIPQALRSNYLPFMNHFLYNKINGQIEVPAVDQIQTTNAPTGNGSLGDAAKACTQQWNRAPAFVLVDFFNVGNPFTVVDGLNGVSGQTSGRLLVPDTVDAATKTPSPTVYQGATGPTAMADMGATSTGAMVRTSGAFRVDASLTMVALAALTIVSWS
ncbi:MAG: hypothetical protein Q9159_003132 [Coniocarpon cinnabarinum]